MNKATLFAILVMFSSTGIIASSISFQKLSAQDTLEGILLFEQTSIDLGKVKKGDHPTFQYKYQNVGGEDLIIEFISLCDCTEADYSTKPLSPGDFGIIDVTFLSERKDENEEITLDILLANKLPGTDVPIVVTVNYTYELID